MKNSTTIEIRANRTRLILFGSYLLVLLTGLNLFSFLNGNFQDNPVFLSIVLAIDAVFGYNLFRLAIRIYRHEPVITLTPSELILNYRGKVTRHPWEKIKKLEVHTDGRYRHVLVDSGEGEVRADVSALEKTPEEVKKLLQGRVKLR